MNKKPNHTKCRKITFNSMKRKRILKDKFKKGLISLDRYKWEMKLPLKQWLILRTMELKKVNRHHDV